MAAKTLDLEDWGLEGLTQGRTVTLYHGSSRLFTSFDISRSREDLVKKYYGAGIFLAVTKNVAESYARAAPLSRDTPFWCTVSGHDQSNQSLRVEA